MSDCPVIILSLPTAPSVSIVNPLSLGLSFSAAPPFIFEITGSAPLRAANLIGAGATVVSTDGQNVFITSSASTGGVGVVGTVSFDLRSNVSLAQGIETQFISFSSGFAKPPFVVYSLSNLSGDPLMGSSQLGGITTGGFNLLLSAAPPTSNYTLSYIATTGGGIHLF